MEFTGEGAKTLSISDRIALCNMAVEAGAKTGIFEADEKAMEYLKEHGREPKAVFHSDPDAHYIREYTIDLSKVEPVVAKPDFVDNLSPAKEVRGIKIDEAFLGSCNNGRIEDLRVGAEVIKGKKLQIRSVSLLFRQVRQFTVRLLRKDFLTFSWRQVQL